MNIIICYGPISNFLKRAGPIRSGPHWHGLCTCALSAIVCTRKRIHTHTYIHAYLSSEVGKMKQAALLQHANQCSKARLLSTSCRESSAWIDAVPCTQYHSLNSDEFRLGILMRLGLPIPSASLVSVCPNRNCGAKIDPQGLHLLTCGKGPGRVRFHDRLVRVWHSLILTTGLRARVEPRGLYEDACRPDIMVPDFEVGRDLHLDFSATNPCLPSNVAAASRSHGAAAGKREKEKDTLYRDCAGIFVPLVLEHHGRWGEGSIRLLKILAEKAAASLPDTSKSQFKDFWVKALDCELQKGIFQTIANNAAGCCFQGNLPGRLQQAIANYR